MKPQIVTIFIMCLAAHATQATSNSESIIKAQVQSLDKLSADTVLQNRKIESTEKRWLDKSDLTIQALMSRNRALADRLRNAQLRRELLQMIYYEAKRSGLDPDLVLADIRVESNFRKYAISSTGARGYMQIQPFWAKIVGESSSDLFNVKTNLRLGCAILRSYLDKEHGNVHRALGRYNGSLGRNEYPNLIYAAWQ